MKHFIKLSLLLLALLLPTTATAHDFEVDGIYYNKNGTEATVTYNGTYSSQYYTGDVTIPSTVLYNGTTYSVTSIGGYAFMGCSGLTSVTIPNSVTSIGGDAFYGCSGLTSVTIPNSVTTIGNGAFYNCSGLASITIGNSVINIGYGAFYGTSWYDNQPNGLVYAGLVAYKYKGTMPAGTSIILADSTLGIAGAAFYECSGLISITIPNSVTDIGERAFDGCSSLTSVNISDIEAWCKISFSGSTSNPLSYGHHLYLNGEEVTDLVIPNSVTSIGDYAFEGCSGLTSVTIPNSVTTIGYRAFYYCSGLTRVTIGNSVTSIGERAFFLCSGLTSVTIPNSVTSIGDYAFQNCSGLNDVFSFIDDPTTVSIGSGVFYRDPSNYAVRTLHVPNGTSATYQANPRWSNFFGSIVELGILATSISLNKTSATVTEGNTLQFTATVLPTNATNRTVTWTSSDEAVAEVDATGLVTAVAPGEATITATTTDGTNLSASCDLTVQQNIIYAASISLNKTSANVTAGNTLQLTATVLPTNTTNKTVMWTSSNTSVATVSSSGLVTAKSSGSATITATTTDGTNLSATCAVTVAADLSDFDNYLSLNDAEAFHGDTIVIPVAMTNAESIISFQTDIFLPDGLELLKEDGEYIIDASERMTRTHSIMNNEVSSGAIRVLCYSSNYKPFTGNSGDDLFYITVKVSDDAEGDYLIQLKNTLLTNTDFVDLVAPDVAANVNVKAYHLGDANNSGTVTITDVVVTAQYVLEMNPSPFIFTAADVNFDNNITVADVSRIVWMILNPTLNAPLRAPAMWSNGDLMSSEGITLAAGETRTVNIILDNTMDYSAFQLDLSLPEGLTAGNFRLTDRAGSHALDVNTLANGKTRALCYSPMLTAIRGNEGAVLTFDVTATTAIDGVINVDGIELVTTGCQTVHLDAFAIAVNNATSANEIAGGKTVARVDYYNLAGQKIDRPESGVTLVVTTFTDGTRTTTKLIR